MVLWLSHFAGWSIFPPPLPLFLPIRFSALSLSLSLSLSLLFPPRLISSFLPFVGPSPLFLEFTYWGLTSLLFTLFPFSPPPPLLHCALLDSPCSPAMTYLPLMFPFSDRPLPLRQRALVVLVYNCVSPRLFFSPFFLVFVVASPVNRFSRAHLLAYHQFSPFCVFFVCLSH